MQDRVQRLALRQAQAAVPIAREVPEGREHEVADAREARDRLRSAAWFVGVDDRTTLVEDPARLAIPLDARR